MRLIQAGTVLSEVLSAPGPTHTLFDVLAAAVHVLSPGPRVVLLGFAAGGVVAPLRALGFRHALEAVDLSVEGERLFRHLSSAWAGEVHLTRMEASRWLRGRKGRYDFILEDLFAVGPEGMAKPEVSLTVLPSLIRRRLSPDGAAVINALPVDGVPWHEVLAPLAAPFSEACVVRLDEYENRLLVVGRFSGGARAVSRRLRGALLGLRSNQASRISVAGLGKSS